MRILVSSIALLLAACFPYPHKTRLTPLMEGWIQRDGVPAVSVRVRAAAGAPGKVPCASKFVEARTDRNGRYVLQPVPKVDLAAKFVPEYESFIWHVCVNEADGWRTVYQSTDREIADFGTWWVSEIRCELAKPTLPCFERRIREEGGPREQELLREKH
jgi:hypothetical protein